jgi:hypothetical protein
MPFPEMSTPPFFETGSGKFATPCERMHSENFNALLIAFWSCAGVNPILPFGSNFWQALFADWYWGEDWSSGVRGLLNTKFPWLLGSGQDGSPCERMHCA